MVSVGIPFAFAMSFIIMNQVDVSINLISMFGLIIVSGMIVDDAIIVGENIYRRIESGMPPKQAVIVGTQEIVGPVFGAVSTTMIAFLPLMFMGGIMGKFMWMLPATIIVALIASLIESFFILPSHVADISENDPTLKANEGKKKTLSRFDRFSLKMKKVETGLISALKRAYLPFLKLSLKHKYLTMLGVLILFAVSIGLVNKIGFILFPKQGIEIFIVKLEAQPGLSLSAMNSRISSIEEAVLSLPKNELDSMSSRVGIHQENPNDPFTKRGKNYAQINVYLTPEGDRDRNVSQIISYLEKKLDESKPVHHLAPVSNQNSSAYLKVSNDPEIEWFDVKNPDKALKKARVASEFLLGGGLMQDNVFVGYSGQNELFTFDLKQKKVISSERISLAKNDTVVQFLYRPGASFGFLYTRRGFLYTIDIENTSKKQLKKYSQGINSVDWITEAGILVVNTKTGADIWEFRSEEGDAGRGGDLGDDLNEADLQLKTSLKEAMKYSYAKKKIYLP